MDLAAVGGDEADALAAVVRGTAAQGDQAVAAFLLIQINGVVDVLVGGVGDGLVEDRVLHAGSVKNVGDLFQDANLHDALVGNDQRFGAAQGLDLVARDFHRANADLGDTGDKITIIVASNHHVVQIGLCGGSGGPSVFAPPFSRCGSRLSVQGRAVAPIYFNGE